MGGIRAAKDQALLQEVEHFTQWHQYRSGHALAERLGRTSEAIYGALHRAGRGEQARKLMAGCWWEAKLAATQRKQRREQVSEC
jgi:hypothetical protein